MDLRCIAALSVDRRRQPLHQRLLLPTRRTAGSGGWHAGPDPDGPDELFHGRRRRLAWARLAVPLRRPGVLGLCGDLDVRGDAGDVHRVDHRPARRRRDDRPSAEQDLPSPRPRR